MGEPVVVEVSLECSKVVEDCSVWGGVGVESEAGDVVGVERWSEVVVENWVNEVSHEGVPQGGAKDGTLVDLVVDGEGGGV